jgi:uncharacterized membrane protein YphA (DoxX/SURF4 family)
MDVIFLIGRLLFGALFISAGIAHVTDKGAMAGYAESRGVKPGRPAVLASGVVILVGAVLIILGIWIDVGAILVALFVLSTAVLMHAFWKESDAQARQLEMTQFMKDMALCGGALILLYLAWEFGGDAGLTITDPLFGG